MQTYSNSKHDYYASMVPFWGEQLDKENYSIWFCKYNFNDEVRYRGCQYLGCVGGEGCTFVVEWCVPYHFLFPAPC